MADHFDFKSDVDGSTFQRKKPNNSVFKLQNTEHIFMQFTDYFQLSVTLTAKLISYEYISIRCQLISSEKSLESDYSIVFSVFTGEFSV